MSPKKIPVRIGLTKKPEAVDADTNLADTSDLLSASTMEALEEMVSVQLSDNDDDDDDNGYELPELVDEIERDADPDYVPEAVPSTSSKGKRLLNKPQVQPKRSLKLVNNDSQAEISAAAGTSAEMGKGRSNAPV